ncbi:hypothetical protein NM688_g3196 [Phlebia brevispora]|uniref:Uncharacterized protein n=1 Tax=Phlebia brevispora TaxID=194682 RepID=A0ACC1T676_9APHY|nr:hypothetical protein NM688_g3196 [Phlebia brevispora]
MRDRWTAPIQSLGRFSQLLMSFTQLSHIECFCISLTEDLLISLGNLPKLVTLHCRMNLQDNSTLALRLTQELFPSLRNLKVYGESFPHEPVELLQTCAMPTFRCIQLYLTQQPKAVAVHSLVCAASKGHRLLQEVVISVTWPTDANENLVVTDAVIEPLFQCHDLRVLILAKCVSGLNDASFGRMAAAWPNLEELHLGHAAPSAYSRVTHRVLHSVATRWSKLRSFGTMIDFASLSRANIEDPDLPTYPTMKILYPESSIPLEGADETLYDALLSAMFPSASVKHVYDHKGLREVRDIRIHWHA